MARLSCGEIEAKARALLAPSGIVSLGWFWVEDERAALLLGNVGGSLWSTFSRSGFIEDGVPDPMNRWTQSTVGVVSNELQCDVRFPFGEPVWPFQRYAMEATGMRASPLGILIHPQYGLWVALRAALVFDEALDIPSPTNAKHPCDSCVEKPCLSTCPVGAFDDGDYDARACRSHLAGGDGGTCLNGGCLARRACPVGVDHAYGPDQQRFHMAAFA